MKALLFIAIVLIYAVCLGSCLWLIIEKTDGKCIGWAIIFSIIPIFNLVYVIIYGNAKEYLKEIFKK